MPRPNPAPAPAPRLRSYRSRRDSQRGASVRNSDQHVCVVIFRILALDILIAGRDIAGGTALLFVRPGRDIRRESLSLSCVGAPRQSVAIKPLDCAISRLPAALKVNRRETNRVKHLKNTSGFINNSGNEVQGKGVEERRYSGPFPRPLLRSGGRRGNHRAQISRLFLQFRISRFLLELQRLLGRS